MSVKQRDDVGAVLVENTTNEPGFNWRDPREEQPDQDHDVAQVLRIHVMHTFSNRAGASLFTLE